MFKILGSVSRDMRQQRGKLEMGKKIVHEKYSEDFSRPLINYVLFLCFRKTRKCPTKFTYDPSFMVDYMCFTSYFQG